MRGSCQPLPSVPSPTYLPFSFSPSHLFFRFISLGLEPETQSGIDLVSHYPPSPLPVPTLTVDFNLSLASDSVCDHKQITLTSIAQPLNGIKVALPIQRTTGEIYGIWKGQVLNIFKFLERRIPGQDGFSSIKAISQGRKSFIPVHGVYPLVVSELFHFSSAITSLYVF